MGYGPPPGGGVAAPLHYVCGECHHIEPRWFAQCSKCSKWNTLRPDLRDPAAGPPLELAPAMAPHSTAKAGTESSAFSLPLRLRPAAAPPPPPAPILRAVLDPLPLSAARLARATARRVATGIGEFDRVLGGGIVDGSVILLGGDPGAGKSTALLQVVHALARDADKDGALYATGEESTQQVALRAERLGIENDRISIVATADVDAVIELAGKIAPTVLVIDSLQTLRAGGLESSPGSPAQVVEVAARVARFAKDTGTPVILIGHVTKDGAIAGPKTLEHLVDVVLYLEPGGGARRLLTSPKNRHGSTDEVGVFEMRAEGLACVEDERSALTERAAGVPGSAVFPAVHGERVQLVEIQALVGATKGRGDNDRPKGSIAVSGIDAKRVQMILAILGKHAAIDVSDRDVFVSVTAGARIADPAADLAIALAIASSYRDLPIDPAAVCFGELGLAGEIRSVGYAHARGREALAGGFSLAVVSMADGAAPGASTARTVLDAIDLVIGRAVES